MIEGGWRNFKRKPPLHDAPSEAKEAKKKKHEKNNKKKRRGASRSNWYRIFHRKRRRRGFPGLPVWFITFISHLNT